MSSGGSLGAMQRLVEQLKLEAALERIKSKFTHADLSGTSLGSRVGVGSVCNCFGKRLCPATRRMQHRP